MDEFDEFGLQQRKKRSPLVLIGACATAGVLVAGLISFRQGNQKASQQFMRARVIFQGVTVGIMAGSAGVMALNDSNK